MDPLITPIQVCLGNYGCRQSI